MIKADFFEALRLPRCNWTNWQKCQFIRTITVQIKCALSYRRLPFYRKLHYEQLLSAVLISFLTMTTGYARFI